MAGDQGSRRGHQCSETLLPGAQLQKCGCIPGTPTTATLGWKQMLDPLRLCSGVRMQELHRYVRSEECKSGSLFLLRRNANLGLQKRNCTLSALNF
jgi:hypothetical protein